MFKRNYRKNIGLMAGVEFFAFLGITSFWILFLSQNSLLCPGASGFMGNPYLHFVWGKG